MEAPKPKYCQAISLPKAIGCFDSDELWAGIDLFDWQVSWKHADVG